MYEGTAAEERSGEHFGYQCRQSCTAQLDSLRTHPCFGLTRREGLDVWSDLYSSLGYDHRQGSILKFPAGLWHVDSLEEPGEAQGLV